MKPNTASASCHSAATLRCSDKTTIQLTPREEAERIRQQKEKTDDGTETTEVADMSDTSNADADNSDTSTSSIDTDEEFELDPRSYPAKSVPARMAIISAGVIMNLIFAVIFAAVAYRVGVRITPAVIGGTSAGDPAWVAGIQPGDHIVKIGKDGKRSPFLRYGPDLQMSVVLNGGDDGPMDLSILRDGEEKVYSITPTKRNKEIKGVPAIIGVVSAKDNKLHQRIPSLPYSAAGNTSKPFQKGDEVIALDGKVFDKTVDMFEELANRPDDAITFTVQRWPEDIKEEDKVSGSVKPEKLHIDVPAANVRITGLQMEMGPATAIRRGSPAEQAGFQVGDIIQSINGQPVNDPMRLPSLFLSHVESGSSVPVKVKRGADVVTVDVTPERPKFYPEWVGPGSPIGIESIGLAVRVTRTVANVVPNSSADVAGLQPGDKIANVEFAPKTDEVKKQMEELKVNYNTEIELTDELPSWPTVHFAIQQLHPKTDVHITYLRGDEKRKAVVTPAVAEDWFTPSRGLFFDMQSVVHQTPFWGEAWRLGARETWERSLQVIGIVKRLFMGRISVTNLSGPLGILQVAGSAASEGIPTLLIFLTMLSANLAVLNFLPIPALDGGHMVFLAAEGIRGKPVDETLQMKLSVLGIGFLLLLMFVATFMDIGRQFFGM